MFQKLEKSTNGYKLFDFGSYYELHSKSGVFRGSLKQVCNHAVLDHGFEMKEIETGVMEMEKYFHNCAEYGVMKTFMWTSDKQVNTTIH